MFLASDTTDLQPWTPAAPPPGARKPRLSGVSLWTGATLVFLIGAGIDETRAQTLVEGTAFPPKSLAIGEGSVAGVSNIRPGLNSSATAIGVESQATGQGSTAIGQGSNALGDNSTATGQGSLAEQNNATANGTGSIARGILSTAIGANSKADDRQATATGASSDAFAIGSSAYGASSVAAGVNSTAIGLGSYAGTANSVSLGANSRTGAVNTGQEATSVTLVRSLTIFGGAPKTSSGLVSIGSPGAERQIQNVAAGRIAADSTDAVNGSQMNAAYQAIGALDTTLMSVTRRLGDETGVSSSAYGATSKAAGDYATAIGFNAQATSANSVALGANSTTGQAVSVTGGTVGGRTYAYAGGSPVGVVSVGANGAERQIQNVAAGRVTSDSTDAVNGSQLYASNQAISAAMSLSVSGLSQSLDALESSISQLSARQAAAQKEARAGIAAAVALVNAPMPSAPGKTSWAGNVARFRDQYAMGFSFAHRLNSNAPLAMTAGVAYSPGAGNVTGRIGMAGEF